jgi:hypothetical protein
MGCEHGDEPIDAIEFGERLEFVSSYKPLKKDIASWSYIINYSGQRNVGSRKPDELMNSLDDGTDRKSWSSG